jgi:hypothetical protein
VEAGVVPRNSMAHERRFQHHSREKRTTLADTAILARFKGEAAGEYDADFERTLAEGEGGKVAGGEEKSGKC